MAYYASANEVMLFTKDPYSYPYYSLNSLINRFIEAEKYLIAEYRVLSHSKETSKSKINQFYIRFVPNLDS